MKTAKIRFLWAMAIFGTVGIFVRMIPMSSTAIAFSRGVVGLIFLLCVMALTKKPPALADIRKSAWVLLLSGAAMGFNWILLFEAYRYTTVATATVCYYLAPAFVILASPLLGERLTAKKLICAAVALAGMVCVSGVLSVREQTGTDLLGVAAGVGAAVLYATVMLLNKKLPPMAAYDKTTVQLGAAALVILPYMLLTEGIPQLPTETTGILCLLVVCVVHTGFAYAVYFGAMGQVKAQTVAIFSYLDPVVAILLSALLLREPVDVLGIVGSVLILGSALYSELPEKVKKGVL